MSEQVRILMEQLTERMVTLDNELQPHMIGSYQHNSVLSNMVQTWHLQLDEVGRLFYALEHEHDRKVQE